MATKARNTIKTRARRLGEVLTGVGLKSGQADSQTILWGLGLTQNGADADEFDLAAGEVVLAQAITSIAASAGVEVAAGAATGVGEFRKVLVEVNAAGAITQVVGEKAASQAAAKLPAGDPTRISVGYIEIPASFTPGTTACTNAMLKSVAYHA